MNTTESPSRTTSSGEVEQTTTIVQSSTTPEEFEEPDYGVDEVVDNEYDNTGAIGAKPIARAQRRLPTNRDEIPDDMVLDFITYELEEESEEIEEDSEDFEDYMPQYEDETMTEIRVSNEVQTLTPGQTSGRQRSKLFDQSFTRRERLANGARGRSISFGSEVTDTEREKEMRGISRICRAVECLQNLRNFVDKRFVRNFTEF